MSDKVYKKISRVKLASMQYRIRQLERALLPFARATLASDPKAFIEDKHLANAMKVLKVGLKISLRKPK